MYDCIIKGATVIDGTGEDGFVADVGISGGKIAFVGNLGGVCDSQTVVDGTGKVLTPGFINMHSHGDQTLFLYPRGEGMVRQGITTCYSGNCGATPGPIDKMWVRKFWEYDAWDEVDPYIESANTILPREKVVPVIERYYNTKIDWNTIGEYMEKLEGMGIGYNYIPNVGHGDIRAQVLGDDSRKPDDSELKQMKQYLVDALEAGVWGLTTGLDYAPGNYADIDEQTALVEIVKSYGGIYTTHWRNRGRDSQTRTRGLLEGFEVAKRTGVRLHVNHLSDLFYTTPRLPGETASIRAGKTLRHIDDAANDGVEFIFDVIPNTSGGFEYVPHLAGYFMPWVRMAGGADQFVKNLQTRDFTGILREWIDGGKGGLINSAVFPEWSKWLHIVESQNKNYTGKSIHDLFDSAQDSDHVDTVLRILKEEPLIRTRQLRYDPEIAREFINHRLALIGIDTFNFDGRGTFGTGKKVPDILVHPNTFCAMPNYLLHFGAPRLEDTVRKITGKPADWLKLQGRGYVKEGYWADLVLLDQSRLATNENYLEPATYPGGIDYVFVNGVMVVREGAHTEARPGKVLRRQ